MKAVDYIVKHLDPILILEYYDFKNIKETDEEIRSCCGIHNGNNPTAFVWNKSNNLWYCYTGDCYGGDVFTLIQKIENVNFITSVKRAAEILGLNITGMKIEKHSDFVLKDTRKWLNYMKRRKNSTLKEYTLSYTKYRTNDSNFKRFSEETITFYNAKFCNVYPTEKTLFYNKLVIPIYFKNVLCGVALRDTTEKSKLKWIYQPKGLEINKLLYNYDLAISSIKEQNLSEIILVEGIFDVWAFHNIGLDNAVAILGSSLKKEQEAILLKSGLDLILAFDGDKAGRKCNEAVTNSFKYKSNITTITFPEGIDPANCTKEDLTYYYINRQ